MKVYGLFALFLICSYSSLCSQTFSKSIEFEEKEYNFGKIYEKKGIVSHTFIFKNIGKETVTISDVVPDCGCTTTDFTKHLVKPGKKGKIKVTFNPYYRPGFFSKEIVVLSNKQENYSRIWIKGNVIPFTHPVDEDYPYSFGKGLHFNLKVLAFGDMKKGAVKSIQLKYANALKRAMTLGFIVEGNNKDVKISNPGKIKSGARGEIIVYYTHNTTTHGETVIVIHLVVNGKQLLQTIKVKAIGIG